MDLIFGSSGIAAADQERMTQINAELGLDRLHRGSDEHIADVSEKAHETK